MRKITLSDGREVFVGCKHTTKDVSFFTKIPGKKGEFLVSDKRRVTLAWLKNDKGQVLLQSEVVCDPRDNFSKAKGRKLAANRLLNECYQAMWDKADRQKVFEALCPEYVPVRRQKRSRLVITWDRSANPAEDFRTLGKALLEEADKIAAEDTQVQVRRMEGQGVAAEVPKPFPGAGGDRAS